MTCEEISNVNDGFVLAALLLGLGLRHGLGEGAIFLRWM
jgi:hypothetical protein